MHGHHKRVHLPPQPRLPSDFEMIEDILRRIHERLKDKDFEPKVGDLLKVLEMKHKLKLAENAKEATRELVEEIREDELGGPESRKRSGNRSD
jgi:hypothetical protein